MRESRDEQTTHSRKVVLAEVLVTALRGVEGEELGLLLGRGGLDLLVGGVFVGVGDLGSFAEAADTDTKVGAGEEGGDYGEEDVAESVS